MTQIHRLSLKNRKLIYLLFVFLVLGCSSKNERIINIYGDSGVAKTKMIYLDKSDTSSYLIINFYPSGDTCEKVMYIKDIIKSRDFLDKSGARLHEEYLITNLKKITSKSVNRDSVIAILHTLWSKKWDSKGRLIFETKLLPNRKEQRIIKDSVGNTLKIDTISY